MHKIREEGKDWVLAGAKGPADLLGWSFPKAFFGGFMCSPLFSFYFLALATPLFTSPILK
jgi:hypothetical protein